MVTGRRTYKKPVLGDVIEIPLPSGQRAFAQYTFNYRDPPHWGALIRVLPGLFMRTPPDVGELVAGPERFYVFFPLGAAVRQKLVQIIDNYSIPDRCRGLPLFKAYNEDYHTGIRTWWLWDGKRSKRSPVEAKMNVLEADRASRTSQHSPWRRGVVLAMLLVVGLWLVATAVVAVRAGLDLRAGRRAGHAARHQSLIAVAEGRPLGQLREAQQRFQRAHSWLGSPILAPVRVLPVVGRQVRSARALAG